MAANLVKLLTEGLAKRVKEQSFDKVLSGIKFLSASEESLSCEMKVEDQHQNLMGTLHGGMTATLVDTMSSLLLMTRNCKSVSMDLNVSFLKAVNVGQDILIDAKLLKLGKNIVFMTVDIKDKATNKLIATGRHTKFILQ